MGDKDILETYLNSASETDIFPHGTKSLLIGGICPALFVIAVNVNRIKESGFGVFVLANVGNIFITLCLVFLKLPRLHCAVEGPRCRVDGRVAF